MDAKTCLKKLEYIGVLAFATVDQNGAPQIRNISAIHYEPDGMYFFTAKGKEFARQLTSDGRVQILGYTKYKEMIRLSAKATSVPDSEQKNWIDKIFEEQPYLKNVYPEGTRDAGIIFQIKDAEIEYFNLGTHPIFRQSYVIGMAECSHKGYYISEQCVGCGTCKSYCPQKCIQEGNIFSIEQEHCLHCGNCFTHCPAQAVKRRG